MNKRQTILTGALYTLAGGIAAADQPADQPNVILLMTDDQGWGDVGYNGHPHLKTPHLDRMAQEGLRFERFYSGAPEQMATDNLLGDDSRIIMDRAIPFIQEAAEREKPFFAAIWFHTPHLPVVAGKKYYDMYDGHDDYARNYYGCITAMDEQIGRLRQALKEAEVGA